jgi:cyclopropane-fatty-acyl-phospholipid synthase
MTTTVDVRRAGTSAAAIARHYDLSEDFFRCWLGEGLVYSCALWRPGEPGETLDAAQNRKIDWFADRLQVRGGDVLDVGCGWGAILERMQSRHGIRSGVGLTPSENQIRSATARAVPDVSYVRQSWADHRPEHPYDAITAIESTEHFASETCDSDT